LTFSVLSFHSRLSSRRKTLFFSRVTTKKSMVLNLKRIFLIAALVILISLPFTATIPVTAQSARKAVILSSLEALAPMGVYRTLITGNLQRAGYSVTFLHDSQVTIDFLLNQLNNYDLIFWRTNTYTYNHLKYWYVGEQTNSVTGQKYASDIATGWININAGILGVNVNFFTNHLASGSLGNVKLAVLISSTSDSIALLLHNAGVQSVIFCNAAITLSFGTIDDLTGLMMSYLAGGQDVYDSVYNTVSPFTNAQPKDQLDANYAPPFWFLGNSALTIT